ncbi:MAG: hypothetical protein KC482_18795 [Dehalococcoidia bacterium]|nr:hypothetical protein [Dehalococcoidia bacterium]
MTILAGIVALPFLIWSWLRHDNQEDFELAIGLIGFIVLSAALGALTWWALF